MNDQVTTVSELVVTAPSRMTLKDIVNKDIVPIGNTIMGVLVALCFLFFIFGIFRYYFLKGGDAKSREEGRAFMLWGLIALAVLFSVWGLVRLVMGLIPTA